MAVVIRAGGMSIIVAVLGIFIFILWQILPLFRSAHVAPMGSHPVPAGDWVALFTDEWSEHPAVVSRNGTITFLDIVADRPLDSVDVAAIVGAPISAIRAKPVAQQVVVGTVDGRVAIVDVDYAAEFQGEKRTITQSTSVSEPVRVVKDGEPTEGARVVDRSEGAHV